MLNFCRWYLTTVVCWLSICLFTSRLFAIDIATLISRGLLTNEQVQHLQSAEDHGYSVRILSYPGEEPTRVLVFLGEKHICKSAAGEEAGSVVIADFPVSGVEGAQCDGCFGACLGMFCYPCLACYYKTAQAITQTGSAIDVAYAQAARTAPQPPQSQRMGESPLARPLQAEPQPNYRVVWLEEGHRTHPSELLLAGEASIWALSALTTFVTGFINGAAAASASMIASYTMLASIGCIICPGLSALALEEYLPLSAPTCWLNYMGMYGLVGNRNATMVANIEKVFAASPALSSLLVIAGKGHGPGIQRELVRDHGWELCPFTQVNEAAPLLPSANAE
jgi:hypothetical protein